VSPEKEAEEKMQERGRTEAERGRSDRALRPRHV
jgi:hypothetical protein